MQFFRRLAFVFFFCVFLPASELIAAKSDSFESAETFPINSIFPAGSITNLETLSPEKIPQMLSVYQEMLNHVGAMEEKNLVALGLGYLQMKKGDPAAAIRVWNKENFKNFILEDYRLYFQAQALREIAEVAMADKLYSKAVHYLNKAIELQNRIYRFYPDSLFLNNLDQWIAETEKLLGDAHFLKFDYKAARHAYRNALVRKFPENQKHEMAVLLALAKIRLEEGVIEESADIYIYLLEHFSSSEIQDAARNFADEHEKELKEKGIDMKRWLPAEANGLVKEGGPSVPIPSPPLQKPEYKSKLVQGFYTALEEEDPSVGLEAGLAVLSHVPGNLEAREIFSKIDELILAYLASRPWSEVIDRITERYSAASLNRLGHRIWKNCGSEKAAYAFRKILNRHPWETEYSHKALFFLGRIEEDLGHFNSALAHYRRLSEQYDFGPYTTAALFKIPWIERLQGEFGLARIHFSELLNFYHSSDYQKLSQVYPANSQFLTAAHYWRAQAAESLDQPYIKKGDLETLVQEYPFDFYALLARVELGKNINELFIEKAEQEFVSRVAGLGVTDRRRLRRAESLIAIGFLGKGEQELSRITGGKDNPEFLYYLAHLFHKAEGFQDAIIISWALTKENGNKPISLEFSQKLFPEAYLSGIRKAALQYNIDPYLVLALMRQESAFNRSIVSSANAVGLMQLLPGTAAHVARSLDRKPPSAEDLKQVEINIDLGIKYLSRLLERFNGNIIFALAAYNAGPNKIDDWVALRSHLTPLEFIESIPYSETRGYVKKVLRNYVLYRVLYTGRIFRSVNELLTISHD